MLNLIFFLLFHDVSQTVTRQEHDGIIGSNATVVVAFSRDSLFKFNYSRSWLVTMWLFHQYKESLKKETLWKNNFITFTGSTIFFTTCWHSSQNSSLKKFPKTIFIKTQNSCSWKCLLQEHGFFGCQKNVNFDRHFLLIHGKFLFRSFKFLEMPLK